MDNDSNVNKVNVKAQVNPKPQPQEMCKYIMHGQCRNGSSCPFAHSVDELTVLVVGSDVPLSADRADTDTNASTVIPTATATVPNAVGTVCSYSKDNLSSLVVPPGQLEPQAPTAVSTSTSDADTTDSFSAETAKRLLSKYSLKRHLSDSSASAACPTDSNSKAKSAKTTTQ